MIQRGIIPLRTGSAPELRVIDGGLSRPDPAPAERIDFARALARQHFAAMMHKRIIDSDR